MFHLWLLPLKLTPSLGLSACTYSSLCIPILTVTSFYSPNKLLVLETSSPTNINKINQAMENRTLLKAAAGAFVKTFLAQNSYWNHLWHYMTIFLTNFREWVYIAFYQNIYIILSQSWLGTCVYRLHWFRNLKKLTQNQVTFTEESQHKRLRPKKKALKCWINETHGLVPNWDQKRLLEHTTCTSICSVPTSVSHSSLNESEHEL